MNINNYALAADSIGLVTCPLGGQAAVSALKIGARGIVALKVLGYVIPASSIALSQVDGFAPSDAIGWGLTAGSFAFARDPRIGCPFAAGSVLNDVIVYGP